MARKKTKEQKIISTNRRIQAPVARPSTFVSQSSTTQNNTQEKKVAIPDTVSLYAYDPIFLKQDLLKTVLISIVILAIQISIYLWLR